MDWVAGFTGIRIQRLIHSKKPSVVVYLPPVLSQPTVYVSNENVLDCQRKKDRSKAIDHGIPLFRPLDFIEAAQRIFQRVFHPSCPHHVEVDLDQTLCQMFIRLHRTGMVSILPEGAFSTLSLVILLYSPACNEQHAVGNYIFPGVHHQQVDMVGSGNIVRYTGSIDICG
ncbi:hypothetical protein UWK_02945 [Desulfocapsa sulfexigens DSM 10523]|uniref:Uncharacterized protein n=1 Tax=Desulfocapsa sulfexigens (strain DSM 10523 / SB164P1) TaxID=1167006 RepID=M1PIT0_DESSD|nr:hypothetical protein UWK_02945 [Desulfocapsa sulfexigens DSM 10523]